MKIRDTHGKHRAALEKRLQSTTSPWDQIPILIALAKEWERVNPNQADPYAQEALKVATELNDQFWIAASMRSLGELRLRTMRYAEALHYLKKGAGIFKRINDLRMQRQTELLIADIYISVGELEKGLRLILRCRRSFENAGDMEWMAFTLRSLGNFYKVIGDQIEAIRCLRQAVSIAAEIGLRSELTGFYMHLAEGYRLIGYKSHEWKYLKKSFALARENNDIRGIAATIGTAGVFFISMEWHPRAEKYIRWSIVLSRALGHTVYQGMSWSMLGTVYRIKQDFPRSLRCFKKGLSLVGKSESILIRGKLYEEMGLLYMDMNEYPNGLRFLQKGLALIEESGQIFFLFQAHAKIADAYEQAGETTRALHHFKEYNRLNEEYIDTQKILEAGRGEFYDKMQRLKERLEKNRSGNDALAHSVEEKEAELAALTQQLINGGAQGGEKPRTINCAPETSDTPFPENWDVFAKQFHKVHNGFYPNLVRKYPELTPTEVKVCSLIRIGLSTKEMATLLCLSKRTVDNHRARIHKKMNLPAGSSLSGFIVRM